MDTNKMRDISREQFEAWLRKEYQLEASDDINFSNGEVRMMLKGWQASRAAVVVELPPKISAHNTSQGGFVRPEAEHYDEAIDDCHKAIEAQGLKVEVKP